MCTLVCYKESKFTHLISVVSPKFFAIMPRGKQFDVGEKKNNYDVVYRGRGSYAKYESELCIDIAESCSPPLPGAAAEK